MKKILIFLLLIALLAVASCSQNANRSEESCPQEDTLLLKKVEYLPDTVEDKLPDSNRPIGGEIPTSLVLINGKSSGGGFPDDHFENGTIKPFSAKELKEILKRKNYIFDDVKIVKDEKSLEKYQREFGSCCHKIKIVYEIKAHPIDQKGEIFEVTAQMPYYPGGGKAVECADAKQKPHRHRGRHGRLYGYHRCRFTRSSFIDTRDAQILGGRL